MQECEENEHVGRQNSCFTGNSRMEAKCGFFKETDKHIVKNGPKELKLYSTLLLRKF